MKSKSFFHQLGWVAIATTVAGVLNSSVHFYARIIGEDQYGLFQTFLQFLLPTLSIPALGLQAAFVQISASILKRDQEKDLCAAMRNVSYLLVILWALSSAGVWIYRHELSRLYKLESPEAIVYVTCAALPTLLLPIFNGVIQGRQDFLWFGWITILAGLGRFAGIGIAFLLFGPSAQNAVLGVAIGALIPCLFAVWRSRDAWTQSPGRFATGSFVRHILPLTVALGAITLLQTSDFSVSREVLTPDQNGLYAAAGSIARSVLYLAAPMIAVLFPRIVREAATSEKSTVLLQACGASLVVCGSAAIGATLLPTVPFYIVQGKGFVAAAAFLPGMAWSLLPLMLTTVLLNNLLARSRYCVAWPLIALALGYVYALRAWCRTPTHLITALGTAAGSALVLVLFFTWLEERRSRARPTVAMTEPS